ncbi:MAG: tRNA 2-thiouridine(34) synthase MnmA [Bacteroidetes bacterium]|nr:tRNA 2-thiouridine(34) synthase MnmA [Bacteroidota bacterium]
MQGKKKVIVGLSGGVDSSVAAYLLKQQGFDVTGVTMAIWDGKPGQVPSGKHACYGPDENVEIEEARELAGILEIPYQVFNCSQRYKTLVLDYFRQEYLSGRTPNPCVKCNQLIKFGMLPDAARMEGLEFDYFATGHYATVEWDDQRKRYLLKRGIDPRKDQTYFIYRLTQEQLSKVLFPIGKMTKLQVREIASRINIPLSEKEESQDFYSGDYKDLLDVKDTPGDIVDQKGKVLGKHNGFWNYTIGQRKGLGVAYSEPLYVISLNKDKNTVVVGTREELMTVSFIVDDLNWIAFKSLAEPMEVEVKIRSAQNAVGAHIEPFEKDSVKVTFYLPNDSITPGQSAVFYQDDLVLGGGVIKEIAK